MSDFAVRASATYSPSPERCSDFRRSTTCSNSRPTAERRPDRSWVCLASTMPRSRSGGGEGVRKHREGRAAAISEGRAALVPHSRRYNHDSRWASTLSLATCSRCFVKRPVPRPGLIARSRAKPQVHVTARGWFPSADAGDNGPSMIFARACPSAWRRFDRRAATPTFPPAAGHTTPGLTGMDRTFHHKRSRRGITPRDYHRAHQLG